MTFDLDAREAHSAASHCKLVAIDDDDVTWVNGIEVGRTAGYNIRRAWRDSSTRAPHWAERCSPCASRDGGGGINGAASLAFDDGIGAVARRSLKFKIGEASSQAADGQHINKRFRRSSTTGCCTHCFHSPSRE